MSDSTKKLDPGSDDQSTEEVFVPPPMLEPGTVIANRFRIQSLIGKGGMGAVYSALDTTLGDQVALKTMLPELDRNGGALRRFKREVQYARMIAHPNVCRIFDFGEHDVVIGGHTRHIVFVTMELLAGETLAAFLDNVGPLTTAQALPIARQIAAGLTAAHGAGVVHRDLKIANVMLVPGKSGPRVVITDFGVAYFIGDNANADSRLTMTGYFVGSPRYVAPEQIDGSDDITPRTDIYAFGIVLYEILTGSFPFEAPNARAAALKRLTEMPRPPRELLPTLNRTWESVILRCLARKPQDRFQSMADVIAALEAAPAESTAPDPLPIESTTEETPRPILPMSPLQSRATAAAAAVLVVAATVALWIRQGPQPVTPPVVSTATTATSTAPVEMKKAVELAAITPQPKPIPTETAPPAPAPAITGTVTAPSRAKSVDIPASVKPAATPAPKPIPAPVAPAPIDFRALADEAYRRGDFTDARRLLIGGTAAGDIEAQARLGWLEYLGLGGSCDIPAALKRLEDAADRGSRDAEAWVASAWLARGSNKLRAVEYARAAADKGKLVGVVTMGAAHASGVGVRRSLAEADRYYHLALPGLNEAVAKGDPWAETVLAYLHLKGRGGLPVDERKAVELYTSAASRQYPAAQSRLAAMYADGRGGLRNDSTKVYELLRAAADNNFPGGQNDLAGCYFDGTCAAKDTVKAVELYRKAAAGGSDVALENLGGAYRDGQGVQANDATAVDYFRQAIARGNGYATYSLGWMYEKGRGVTASDQKAVELYTQGAEQGVTEAQWRLGVMYAQGRGDLQKDDKKAVELYRKAADQDLAVAQINLAEMYETGRGGLTKSRDEALKLYRKAAERGNEAAKEAVQRLTSARK
jgi:TPR repeat protein/serine/threonine protein kinase